MPRNWLTGSILVFLGGVGLAACSSSSNPVAPSISNPVAPSTASPVVVPPIRQTARYRITFDALWSDATHPQDFPSNPHFSPLVGGTHNASARFWQEGNSATDGVRDMAEQGRTSPLDSEVRAAVAAGSAEHVLLGGDVPRSPGTVSLEFEISQSHPLVTLVTMVAPSPDWFTGVSGLALFENGAWADRRVVELGSWDAGTDSGPTFTSPDQLTTPRQAISRLTGFPFLRGGQVAPLARFTFERIQ